MVGSFQNTPYWSVYSKIMNRWIDESKFQLEVKNPKQAKIIRNSRLRKFGTQKTPLKRSRSACSTMGSESTADRESILLDIAKANSERISIGVGSSKKDFEAFLKKELSGPLHPARQLISVFLATFKSFFGTTQFDDDQAESQDLYQQIVLPTKNFIDVVRQFVKLIYQEEISTRSSEDEEEEDDENYYDQLIDQIICDIIFREPSSTICRFVYRALEIRRKEEILYFETIIQKYKEMSLKEIDKHVPEKYLLSDWKNPYQSVIDAIKLQGLLGSPYLKRDILTTIEERIKNTIHAYNQKENNKNVSLILEADQKFAIYAYSLIKSGYKKIILDLDFIDEFARYGEQNQPYIHLKGCLQQYILAGEFEKYLLQHC